MGHSQFKVMHNYIQDSSILTLSYPGSRVDQLWSKPEDIAIITIFLSPGCQQPFLIKMASDNRLSAAVFGPKRLVTTGCQQPLPFYFSAHCVTYVLHGRQCFQGKLFIRHNRNGKGKIQMIDYLNKHFPPCRNCCKARTSKVLLDF